MRLLLVLLIASPACAVDFVLYGHGQGGDGFGYGVRDGYVSQRTGEYSATPQDDTEPWGRWDNTVPGYRSHGKRFSHPYYGHTPGDVRVTRINPHRPIPSEVHERIGPARPARGRVPLRPYPYRSNW